jgi:hypothetical protein
MSWRQNLPCLRIDLPRVVDCCRCIPKQASMDTDIEGSVEEAAVVVLVEPADTLVPAGPKMLDQQLGSEILLLETAPACRRYADW